MRCIDYITQTAQNIPPDPFTDKTVIVPASMPRLDVPSVSEQLKVKKLCTARGNHRDVIHPLEPEI